MIFKVWEKKKDSRKPLRFDEPRKKRNVLDGVNPRLKQKALDRLAILRAYRVKLSEPRRPRSKSEVTRKFLELFNSGVLCPDPDGATKPISHIGKSTLNNLERAYKKGGLAALVPRYKTKRSAGQAVFQPLKFPFEMKFPGPPRRNGKRLFLERLKRRWKRPTLGCPIHLTLLYIFPIPKGTKMPRRMKMLKHKIAHTGKPNSDVLNAFIIDSLMGIVFKHHSQIIQFHSKKEYGWWPQTRILIRPVKG